MKYYWYLSCAQKEGVLLGRVWEHNKKGQPGIVGGLLGVRRIAKRVSMSKIRELEEISKGGYIEHIQGMTGESEIFVLPHGLFKKLFAPVSGQVGMIPITMKDKEPMVIIITDAYPHRDGRNAFDIWWVHLNFE